MEVLDPCASLMVDQHVYTNFPMAFPTRSKEKHGSTHEYHIL